MFFSLVDLLKTIIVMNYVTRIQPVTAVQLQTAVKRLVGLMSKNHMQKKLFSPPISTFAGKAKPQKRRKQYIEDLELPKSVRATDLYTRTHKTDNNQATHKHTKTDNNQTTPRTDQSHKTYATNTEFSVQHVNLGIFLYIVVAAKNKPDDHDPCGRRCGWTPCTEQEPLRETLNGM